MRRRMIAVGCAAAAVSVLAAAPAQAAGSVHISQIYYNSPGSDNRSNTSLNGEWVLIKNSTSRAVSLKNWTLTDSANHKYTFGTFTLGVGKTVKVRTGRGTNTSATRYQNRRAYVWNNDKDKATLRKSTGSTADTCSYNNSRVSSKTC